MSPDDFSILRRGAERARQRPEFLGWVLAQYEHLESLAEEAVREHLGVAAENWSRLQLCLRPRAGHFLPDLTQIVQACGGDRAALASVIRRVEAIEAVRAGSQPGQLGTFLAARTRKGKRRPPEGEAPRNE